MVVKSVSILSVQVSKDIKFSAIKYIKYTLLPQVSLDSIQALYILLISALFKGRYLLKIHALN